MKKQIPIILGILGAFFVFLLIFINIYKKQHDDYTTSDPGFEALTMELRKKEIEKETTPEDMVRLAEEKAKAEHEEKGKDRRDEQRKKVGPQRRPFTSGDRGVTADQAQPHKASSDMLVYTKGKKKSSIPAGTLLNAFFQGALVVPEGEEVPVFGLIEKEYKHQSIYIPEAASFWGKAKAQGGRVYITVTSIQAKGQTISINGSVLDLGKVPGLQADKDFSLSDAAQKAGSVIGKLKNIPIGDATSQKSGTYKVPDASLCYILVQ